MARSRRLGSATPEGWLWAKMTAAALIEGVRGAGQGLVAGTLVDQRRHQTRPPGPVGVVRCGGHWLRRLPDIDGAEQVRRHGGGEPLVVIDARA